MNNFFIKTRYFFLLSIFTVILFFIHEFLISEYFAVKNIPLIPIYTFNYVAVIILVYASKFNLRHHFTNPLTFFVILTLIKMLSVVAFFLYFKQYFNYDIIALVYHFFPVYFVLLTLEIWGLKKSLNNI